jgi:solute carrier family 35 protein F5
MYSVLDTSNDDINDDSIIDDTNTSINNSNNDYETVLSDPIWVPIKFNNDNSCVNSEKSSGTESDTSDRTNFKNHKFKSNSSSNNQKSVRFSKLTEVRQLSESQAEEALLARLSYQATLRAQESAYSNSRINAKLTIIETAKLSLVFCTFWFAGNLSYQLGLKYSEAGLVNVLSSTSSLFTILLSSIFPSNSTADKFSLTKLIAVVISVGSVAIISTAESRLENISYIPIGGLWALCGAFFYAAYIVMLRHKVDNEDSIDIPMFFGWFSIAFKS